MVHDQVKAFLLVPHLCETGVVNENVSRPGCVRAVLQIIHSPVEQGNLCIRVEENRSERVVLIIDDQLAEGRFESASARGREDR